jgi:hypothetical protein
MSSYDVDSVSILSTRISDLGQKAVTQTLTANKLAKERNLLFSKRSELQEAEKTRASTETDALGQRYKVEQQRACEDHEMQLKELKYAYEEKHEGLCAQIRQETALSQSAIRDRRYLESLWHARLTEVSYVQ